MNMTTTSSDDMSVKPEPMELFCPECGEIHLDEGEWEHKPHKTHQCQHCKHEWRPFEHATVGVKF